MDFLFHNGLPQFPADIVLLHFLGVLALTLHDEFEEHVFVGEVVFPLIPDYSVQNFRQDLLIQTDELSRIGVEYFVDVKGKEGDAHIEEIVPALGVVDASQLFMALLEKQQAVWFIYIGNKNLTDIQVLEFGHPQVVWGAQKVNRRGWIGYQECDVLGLQVLDEKEVGIAGDPIGQGQSELD